jgi:hypothetical protein
MPLTLEQVHTIEAKGTDLDQGFCVSWLGLGSAVVDVERICVTGASLYI